MQRKPLLAAFLSFFIAGLGQIYVGRFLRGMLGYALHLFSILLSMFLLVKLSFGLLPLAQVLAIQTIIGVLLAIDAYKLAKRAGDDFIPKFYNKWYVYLLMVVALVYLSPTFYAAYTIIGAARVPTGAMQNTIIPGDHIILDKTAYNIRNSVTDKLITSFHTPQRGDIITFYFSPTPETRFKEKVRGFPEDPSTVYIFRVVATAGETVETKGPQLFINGQLMVEPYVKLDAESPQLEDFGPYVVPVNQVFVMGDNRNGSIDSRKKGGVPLENILAKAKGFYWSKDETTGRIRWERIGKALH